MTGVSFFCRLASLVILLFVLLDLTTARGLWVIVSPDLFWLGIGITLGIVSLAIELSERLSAV